MCFCRPLEGMEEMLQGLQKRGCVAKGTRWCDWQHDAHVSEAEMNIACHATKARLI